MRDWESLTDRGRIRRLRQLAAAALDHYEVRADRLRLVGGFTNVVYRVDSGTGSYALRVDLFQEHADRDVDIEVAWLEALAGETDLDVARVVRPRAGGGYVHAVADGVPGARRCTMFEWIPGRPIAERLTEERYRRLGRITALLHRHGATFDPPVEPMRWDRIFYWPDDVVIHDRVEGKRRQQLLDAAIATVESAFDRLPVGGAQVVHGDLHPWNVHGVRNRLYVLDFEDVMSAHPVQDVSVALFYERDNPAYADLRAAFTEGYRSLTPWPEAYDGEVEQFIAARLLMFIDYVLRTGVESPEWVARSFDRVEEFVKRHA